MALLEDSWLQIEPKTRTTSTGPASSSVLETSGSSGGKSIVGTSFPHISVGMKRSDACFELPIEKRIKLEPTEAVTRSSLPISLLSSSEHKQDDDLPPDFLEPLSSEEDADNVVSFSRGFKPLQQSSISEANSKSRQGSQASRQFWKAGDYEGHSIEKRPLVDGMDHVRVHPKFLHSNATSHKWALGAVAELFDNALDEVSNGATFVKVDTLNRQGDEDSPMLLFEDNGGGMDPDRLRHCMSLGYSVKSKMANTIGQYGNGFKTSTMRLGADVIVFSCSPAREGRIATRSIGLMSYTFLRETGQQDIVVPMIDFEVQKHGLQKLIRGQVSDWNKNMEIIKRWSPFSTESELLDQLTLIGHQGTRIIVYNLWENDQGELELDFDTDPHDIQLRGVNRDPKSIAFAELLPNSKHFLTYRHSLRSYASILYLRLPSFFKIILRGVDIRHHCLVDDLMIVENHTYRPWRTSGGGKNGDEQGQTLLQGASDMKAVVTLGFVKDAKEHADVQGFNVYHKNRLIKPFWRVWNAPGSNGRGIIGVLEANFVEPAHDKQGFERTSVLARLEARLLKMQKDYWCCHSHKIGYCNHHAKKQQQKQSASLEGSTVELDCLKSPGQNGIHLPKAFPKSSRSQVRRLPARRFRIDTLSSTCTGSATLSGGAPEAAFNSELPRPSSLQEGNLDCDDINKNKQVHNAQQMQAQAFDAAQRFKSLETQLVTMESLLEDAQNKIKEALKERDSLKQQLEEERRHGEVSDAELRKKLKETILRVKELEAENKRLQAS